MSLDGNTAGGLLAEVFAIDMTAAIGVCDHCGTRGPLAAAILYPGGPGDVLRCPACGGVLMRAARLDGRLVLEAQGVRMLEVRAG